MIKFITKSKFKETNVEKQFDRKVDPIDFTIAFLWLKLKKKTISMEREHMKINAFEYFE